MTLVVTVWCFLYYFHRLSFSDDATRNVKKISVRKRASCFTLHTHTHQRSEGTRVCTYGPVVC